MHVTVYISYTHLPCTHFKVSQHNQYACHRVHTMYILTMYSLQGLPVLAYMHVSVYVSCTHLPCTQLKVSQHNQYACHLYIPCTPLPCTHFKVSHNQYACHLYIPCTPYHIHTSRSPSTTSMHVTCTYHVHTSRSPTTNMHVTCTYHVPLTIYTLQGLPAQPVCMSPVHTMYTLQGLPQPICMSLCTH